MGRAATAMVLALALCGAANGAPAVAQAQAAAPAATPAPSEKTVKLVRRVLAANHIERQTDTLLAAMMPVLMEQQAKNSQTLSDDDRQLIIDLTRKIMSEKFVPKLIELSVPIYASIYTDDELEAMASFYESPVGQSVLAKTAQVAPKVAQATRQLLPELTADLTKEVFRELCTRTNCLQPPAAIPKARPS